MRRIIALAMLGGSLVASSEPETLTQKQARAMTTPDLARRVLGMAGNGMREHQVFGGGLPGDSPHRLATIAFTAGATSAGWPGLCKAVVTLTRFAPIDREDRSADPASVAGGIESYPMWSIIPRGNGDQNDHSAARYQRDHDACVGRGAVFSDDTQFFRATWNSQRDLTSMEATFVARIARVLDNPASDVRALVRCADDQVTGCPDAATAITRIDTSRPERADVSFCGQNASHLCLTFKYESQGESGSGGWYTAISVETDATTLFDDSPTLLSVTLHRRGWVV